MHKSFGIWMVHKFLIGWFECVYFPEPRYCTISDNASVNSWIDCTAAHTNTEIESRALPDFLVKNSVLEATIWVDFSLAKLDSKKTTVNCLISLQQYTLVCQIHLALLHLFSGSVRLQFHNSYTAVQSLLTVLTILYVKPTYQCVSGDRRTVFSETVPC